MLTLLDSMTNLSNSHIQGSVSSAMFSSINSLHSLSVTTGHSISHLELVPFSRFLRSSVTAVLHVANRFCADGFCRYGHSAFHTAPVFCFPLSHLTLLCAFSSYPDVFSSYNPRLLYHRAMQGWTVPPLSTRSGTGLHCDAIWNWGLWEAMRIQWDHDRRNHMMGLVSLGETPDLSLPSPFPSPLMAT